MTVIELELPDDQVAALKAKAEAAGLTLEAWLKKLASQPDAGGREQPFTSGYGMLSKYGPAPSSEEIDANRREMFSGFAREF